MPVAIGSLGNSVKPRANKIAQPPFATFLPQCHKSNSTYVSLMSSSLTSSRLHHVVITDFAELKTAAFCCLQITQYSYFVKIGHFRKLKLGALTHTDTHKHNLTYTHTNTHTQTHARTHTHSHSHTHSHRHTYTLTH
jgi:hypothetical protein